MRAALLQSAEPGLPVDCARECPLMTTTRPLDAAVLRADSANIPIPVATMTLGGVVGDSVLLKLSTDTSVLAAMAEARLIVETPDGTDSVTPLALTHGVVVYRFTAPATVTLTYALTRRVSAPVQGSVRLVQVTADAQVLAASTPWVPLPVTRPRAVALAADSAATTTCPIMAASGSCDDMTYSVVPFAPGAPFGDFQSDPGTGQSHDIVVTFSKPVSTVDVTLVGGSFPGNEAIAYDSTGAVVASVSFGFHPPDVDPSPWEDPRVLTGRIVKVLLVAADLDYVGYKMSVVVESSPPGVHVDCKLSDPHRGKTIRCTTTVVPAQPYTVVRRVAKGKGFQALDETRTEHAAGEADIWEGTAVASSDVRVTVEVNSDGQVRQMTNKTPSHFEVQPRAWPDWKLTTLTARMFAVVPGYIAAYAVPGTDLGVFQLETPDAASISLGRASKGPNDGLAYVEDPIEVTNYMVGLYPGLQPPPNPEPPPTSPDYRAWYGWYDDQNGVGSGTCAAADVATLLSNVDRHEGSTMASNSHFGVANTQFATLHPQSALEALYTSKSDAELRKNIDKAVTKFVNGGQYRKAQQQFDKNDTKNVFNIGCMLDFNAFDR